MSLAACSPTTQQQRPSHEQYTSKLARCASMDALLAYGSSDDEDDTVSVSAASSSSQQPVLPPQPQPPPPQKRKLVDRTADGRVAFKIQVDPTLLSHDDDDDTKQSRDADTAPGTGKKRSSLAALLPEPKHQAKKPRTHLEPTTTPTPTPTPSAPTASLALRLASLQSRTEPTPVAEARAGLSSSPPAPAAPTPHYTEAPPPPPPAYPHFDTSSGVKIYSSSAAEPGLTPWGEPPLSREVRSLIGWFVTGLAHAACCVVQFEREFMHERKRGRAEIINVVSIDGSELRQGWEQPPALGPTLPSVREALPPLLSHRCSPPTTQKAGAPLAVSGPTSKPSKLSRTRNQITSLLHDSQSKALELEERAAAGRRTKSQVRGRYGW